jgi:hypothetical protein
MKILIGIAGERRFFEGTPELIFFDCKERLRDRRYARALPASQIHEILARELASLRAYLHAQDLIQRLQEKVRPGPVYPAGMTAAARSKVPDATADCGGSIEVGVPRPKRSTLRLRPRKRSAG